MKRIAIGLFVVALLIALAIGGLLYFMSGARDDPAFFESEILAFEEADRANPPAPGQIVFVGSSSIRFWSSLEEDMAPLAVLNRGFGGAHLSHVIHNAGRIIVPYAPRAVVLYAGDNDMASGKTVDVVVRDYQTLIESIHAALPQASIYYLPIKPSRLRWSLWPEMARANAEIEAITRTDDRLHYIDVASVLLAEDGTPRDDVFVFDGLHMNATGYAAWTKVVAPVLRAAYGASAP